MAASTTSVPASFPVPYHVVFQATIEALPPAGVPISGADPATGIISAYTPLSVMSWGEKIAVRLWGIDAGTTGVVVESRLSFGLFDWGRNQRNIDKVLAAIHGRLYAPTMPPPPGP